MMNNQGADYELNFARRLQQGSEDAWNEFYTRYSGLVRSIVRRKGWALEQETEDLAQMVFVALVDSIDSFQSAGSLSGFVGVVAERICLQEYRKRTAIKRDAATSPIDHHDNREAGEVALASEDSSPEDSLTTCESTHMLREALERIGDKCREILRLRYFDEMSYKEISRIIEATENTLTVRVRRCLDRLGEIYGNLERQGI